MAASHIMMLDKTTVLQRAIREVTRDIIFTNRWASVTSIEKGINSRYQFDSTTKFTKISISRSITKIEPCLDTLTIQNSSGIYRGKYKNESPGSCFNVLGLLRPCTDGGATRSVLCTPLRCRLPISLLTSPRSTQR